MSSRPRPSWLLAAPAVLVTGLVALLLQSSAVLVHQCLPGGGAAGWLGLRLALLREGECPAGQLAIGGDPRSVMTLVVLVTLPVLLTHLAMIFAGASLLLTVRTGLRAAVSALRGLVRRLPQAPALRSFGRWVVLTTSSSTLPAARVVGPVRRRGPPVPAAA